MLDHTRHASSAALHDHIHVSTSTGPFWLVPGRWAALATEPPLYAIHHMLELGIVLRGRLRLQYSQWTTELRPGDVWFTGLWERHARVPVKVPCEEITLMVLPATLMQMNWSEGPRVDWTLPFKVAPQYRPTTADGSRVALLALAAKLRARNGDLHDPDQGLWFRLVMLEALLILRRGWRPPEHVRPFLNPDYASMTAAVEMVTSTTGLIRSQEAARQVGLSRNIFARRFKDFTGLSFPEFCLRFRLSRAANQLLETTDSIKSVAHDWGFTHGSHLHRLFLLHYGCSPGEFRKYHWQ